MQEFEITSQVLVAGATFYVWVSAMRESRRRPLERVPELVDARDRGRFQVARGGRPETHA